MERRTFREIERRLALVFAQSFHNIRFQQWDQTSPDGTTARLKIETAAKDSLLVPLEYKGSALLRLDGRPYWSLDGYHKSLRIPAGRHEITAEFSPYLAFGEKTQILPGTPVLAERNEEAYRFWNYGVMVVELAKLTKDKELSEDLLDALSSSLKEAFFEGVTHEQLVLANYLSEKFPKEIVEILPESSPGLESLGYRENGDASRWTLAQQALEKNLRALESKYGKRGEILAIAHGHIDTAWLWPFDETERKVSRTFSVIASLMERISDFHYMQSMALYYDWTKRNNPDLYEKIKEFVRIGRWELGAGWVENDANMISGESFARQLLYSQKLYQKEFGKLARVYWLPDTFGFTASLPQIAILGGVRLFATHKLFWNETNTFPYSLFKWIGIDGTVLPSIAFGHGKDGYNSTFEVETIIEQWTNWADKNVDLPMLYAFGYGDGGGGPTEEMFLRAEALEKLPILPKQRWRANSSSSSLEDNYLPLLSTDQVSNKWRGELYLERHRGVQTSHTRIKYLNRRAELGLREAEIWSTIQRNASDEGPTGPSIREKLEGLWKILLKHQFHDVLPGSAIREAYSTAYAELESVIAEAARITETSSRELATIGETLGTPEEEIVLFNSLPWVRDGEYVALAKKIEGSQQVDGGHLLKVNVPSVGYRSLDSPSINQHVDGVASVLQQGEHYLIENRFFRLVLDGKDGTLSSIFDKEAQRETLHKKSNVFVFYENIPGWGDAWDIEQAYKTTSFEASTVKECRIIESGPLRVCVRLRFEKFRHSTIEQEIMVYADSRRIDLKTTSDLHDRELLLKVWFHFDINSDKAVYDIPFGNMERPTTTNTSWDKARFEVPMQKWVDISEGNYGVALLNDGRYGIAAEQSSLGLSIAKTPIYPDYSTEGEPSTFTFSIYPHIGDWKGARVAQRAYELNAPIMIMKGKTRTSGSSQEENHRSNEKSFINIDSDNIMLEAVKESEDASSMIVRLFEHQNKRGTVRLDFWKNIKAVSCTDLIENSPITKELETEGRMLQVPYCNYEIITLRIQF
jgi:alpha-mannosidase